LVVFRLRTKVNEAFSESACLHSRAASGRVALVSSVVAIWLGANLAACGSDDAGDGGPSGSEGSGAAGGESATTGDTASTSSVTSAGAGASGGHGVGGAGTTGVGGGGGGGPVDRCYAACALDHSEGQVTYDEYAACIYCGECANDCAAQAAGMCVDPPTGDACDYGGDCQVCADCANGSGCSEKSDACATQPDCVAYANCIAACEQY
jgi:hypothetical protein